MQTPNPPRVSVVMITSNVERFLGEAIESVLGQTFRDFEFIILDYGSTDKSKDIVSSYAASDSRIKLSTIPPCTYIEAKIAACSLAQGQYIAIQDADDNSLPDRLLWEVEFMEKNPGVAVVGSAADWINSVGKYLLVSRPPTSHEEIKTAFLTSSPFVHTSVLMRREIFIQVGGYRKVLLYAEDYDLFARISERFPCVRTWAKWLFSTRFEVVINCPFARVVDKRSQNSLSKPPPPHDKLSMWIRWIPSKKFRSLSCSRWAFHTHNFRLRCFGATKTGSTTCFWQESTLWL